MFTSSTSGAQLGPIGVEVYFGLRAIVVIVLGLVSTWAVPVGQDFDAADSPPSSSLCFHCMVGTVSSFFSLATPTPLSQVDI